MAHARQELEVHKRKRDPDDGGAQTGHGGRIPQPPPRQLGNVTPINYLTRANPAKLRLIPSEPDVFSDVLDLIEDHEGVLTRTESLAANLGAKLTGPRLLKAMEGVFEGPITLSPQVPHSQLQPQPVTWLDIVELAKTQPSDFVLSSASERGRVCQFFLKGFRVEITEDDWRLIVSGALDRFGLLAPHPVDEDEAAELATVDIVEQGLLTLIRRADEVARKARQLNYHLSGRRAAIAARKAPASGPGAGFQSVNQQQQQQQQHGPLYDIHADLLSQFLAATAQSRTTSTTQTTTSKPPMSNSALTPLALANHNRTHFYTATTSAPHASPLVLSESSGDKSLEDPSGVHRLLVQRRIEKAQRGDAIVPPCDRCRRLKLHCIKHLTACQGCTRKHAKCSWRAVTDDEAALLRAEGAADANERDRRRSLLDDGEQPGAAGLSRSDLRRSLSGKTPLPERGLRTDPAGTQRQWSRAEEDVHLDGRAAWYGPPPLARSVDGELGSSQQQQHSLLSHMATIATAEAEAREAQAATSRGSSTSRD